MQLPYKPEDIFNSFDPGSYKRGINYYIKGMVESVDSNESGTQLSGIVKGSGNNRYQVHVLVDNTYSRPSFSGRCSCPVGHNCKHAVALLYTAWFQLHDDIVEEDASSSDSVVEKWLNDLEFQLNAPEVDTANDVAENSPNRLLYVLKLSHLARGDEKKLIVEYLSARKLKAKGFGKASRYDPERIVSQGRAKFMTTDDENILREVYARKKMDFIEFYDLSAPGGGDLLLKMVATGRCFWESKDSEALKPGETQQGKMHWQTFDDGSQKLGFSCEKSNSIVLSTIPPTYLIQSTGECGLLKVDVAEEAVKLIQKSPKVPVEKVTATGQRIKKLIKDAPQPLQVKTKVLKNIKPVPQMHFSLYEFAPTSQYGLSFQPQVFPVIEITLRYQNTVISLFENGVELSFMQNDELVKLKRNLVEEKKYLDFLETVPLIQMQKYLGDSSVPKDLFSIGSMSTTNEADIWMGFILEVVPELEKQGWKISYDEDFPYEISYVDDWEMVFEESSDQHWFDLSLDISVDGERYNLIQIISALINQNPHIFKKLHDPEFQKPENMLMRLGRNKTLLIPFHRIERIVTVLLELFDKQTNTDKIRIPKWRASEINELQAQGMVWQGDKTLKKTADRLNQFKAVKPIVPPKNFKAELREYQKQGLSWLQFLREYGFHGVLADDMGLGKTVQTLAHICVEKTAKRLKKPVLVVAPTSLMYNWRHEAAQFAPHLKVLTLQGPNRKQDFDRINEHDIVMTTYPLLGRDDEVLLAHEWHMLILDEAQNIKNPKAKATRIASQIKANHRLCLTGTPMENHLGELWSMFNFLMPGLLGDEKQFRQLFRNPIEKQGDTERAKRLSKRLAPFMLRRKKDEVVKELPAKTEIVRTVELEGVQRDLYETIRVSMQKKVRDSINKLGMNKSHIIVLDALLKLRQICCDPRLLKSKAEAKKANSAKLDLLMQLLPELLDEGRKVLLFSQFTSMLGLIEEELKARKIKYAKLTGSTRNREKPISDFQTGKVPLFLISLKAGGTGLNLTTADTVIHYDPWWNPAVEAQATDRAHRIGQEKPVFVYKLITENTVEEKIQTMQESKRKLAEGLFSEAGKSKLPDANDLEALFEPL